VATAGRREAEAARRAHEQRRQAERRTRAEARERVLRFEGEVSALRSAVASTEAELGRVSQSLAGVDERVAEAEAEVASVQDEITSLDAAEVELTADLEAGEEAVATADARVDELAGHARDLEAARASSLARAEALRAALAEADGGTAALLDGDLDGVLGPVASHVRSDAAHDATLAAALGPLGEAVVVTTPNEARRAIAWLRDVRAGSAVVLAARPDRRAPRALDDEVLGVLEAAGASPVADLLAPAEGDPHAADVVAALQRVLQHTWRVPDWSTAVLLHGREPDLTFVTPDGDVAGPLGYRGGESPANSAVVTATAAAEAEERAAGIERELAEVAEQRAEADAALAEARSRLAGATERINESDARITGAAERLARLNKELHTLANQRNLTAASERDLGEVLARDRATLDALVERGPQVETDLDDVDEGPDEEAFALDEAVEAARERELDGRVRLERTTEQVRHLELQAAELRAEADEVEQALAEAARRREARRRGIARCGELGLVARAAVEALDRALAEASTERDTLQRQLGERRAALAEARRAVAAVDAELQDLRERRHQAELRRADVAQRLEQLAVSLRDRFSVGADELAAEHPQAAGYDTDALGEREDVLVRKVGLLGRVNPLALEEFKALEERHAFLSDQLDDLRRSKRDLEEVVVQVDDRIRSVFAEAFEDVAREFELTFATVFPGGSGRLVLTDPDDLLATGIEVEGRPPGKKVTRLSLLSGGERSLTVLAFVFAIFRARPSPFYVLDEVDAALDDVNLQRLLKVVRSFRGHAQVIVVTHQKRSMEIADVMYGITMGPDAVTKVVSERLREGREATHTALEQRASDAPTEAIAATSGAGS
jgi:chromosome segregation protein